jgi:hypothetical protein
MSGIGGIEIMGEMVTRRSRRCLGRARNLLKNAADLPSPKPGFAPFRRKKQKIFRPNVLIPAIGVVKFHTTFWILTG